MRVACVLWSVPHLSDTAAACVTELVSNVVKHAQWPDEPDERVLWLITSLTGPYLVVEVCDPDRTLPVVGGLVDWDGFDWSSDAEGSAGESGFGLFTVVERVRECGGEFGMVLSEVGKTIFFALPLSSFRPRGPISGGIRGG